MSSLGRKPVFTRLSAFQMLENRRLYGGNDICADDFIELMVASGELAKPCSSATMSRLLNGSLFPDLHVFVPDGKGGFEEGMDPYDYVSLPRRPNGRPAKSDRIRPDGTLRPRYTASQKKMVDDFTRISGETAANAAELVSRTYGDGLGREIETLKAAVTTLKQMHEALKAEVVALKAGRPA